MDSGYRGLHRDHPGQVSVPPKKPAKDAARQVAEAWEQARHAQVIDPDLRAARYR
jgi:hypothetical protein